MVVKLYKDSYIIFYFQEKFLRIVDNANSARSITIVDGVILKGEPEKRSGKKLDALPEDFTARDAEVNDQLYN